MPEAPDFDSRRVAPELGSLTTSLSVVWVQMRLRGYGYAWFCLRLSRFVFRRECSLLTRKPANHGDYCQISDDELCGLVDERSRQLQNALGGSVRT